MISRGRARGGSELDLAARAQTAAGRVTGEVRPVRGGLTGAVARALRWRRRAPAAEDSAREGADTAELLELRGALARELERVADGRPPGEKTASGPTDDRVHAAEREAAAG